MRYTNINGKLLPDTNAFISVDNSAFRYGYGLFETMLIMDGSIQLEEYHWKRLFEGMALLGLNNNGELTPPFLKEEILRTVVKNQDQMLCRVRLTISGNARGFADIATLNPEFTIECFKASPEIIDFNKAGLSVGIAEGLVKTCGGLSHLKTSSALIYAAAGAQASKKGWDDVLLLNNEGNIVETTIANIFWIKNGEVFTPPLGDGCIAGVMRSYLANELPGKGYMVSERSLSVYELEQADEVFITNAIRRIKWIGRFGSTGYPDKKTRELYAKVFNY